MELPVLQELQAGLQHLWRVCCRYTYTTPIYKARLRERKGKICALLGRILVPATAFSVILKGFWTVFKRYSCGISFRELVSYC